MAGYDMRGRRFGLRLREVEILKSLAV